MYIGIDFDGTVVAHEYPRVGRDIGAVPVLKKIRENGHKLILNTMRSRNCQGEDTLQPALDWFKKNGIQLNGVNNNPSQMSWTTSPKVYANLYIDDAALGIPLTKEDEDDRPYVDWDEVALLLTNKGVITVEDAIELLNNKKEKKDDKHKD